MKRNVLVLAIVIFAVAGMIYVGAHLAKRPQYDAPKPGALDLNKIPGVEAPDFTLKTLDGKTAKLSDYRGKAVVLNFWATWCGPCKIEMPWLVDLNTKYGPQGLVILGVAMDEDVDTKDWVQKDVQKFAHEMSVNYPVLFGTSEVGDTYGGVQFLPEIFYIDRNGKVVEHAVGLKGRGEIEDNIKKALGQ